MYKTANSRSFNYDVSGLFGYSTENTGQVTMVISSMVGGQSWCGLGNGTHKLTGVERLISSPTTGHHIWYFKDTVILTTGTSPEWLALWDNRAVTYSPMLPYFSYNIGPYTKGSKIQYNGTMGIVTSPVISGQYSGTPSIGAGSVALPWFRNSVMLNYATFTWSQGSEWDRGNM